MSDQLSRELSQTTTTIEALPVGRYFFRVRARNENDTSEPSNEVTAEIIDVDLADYIDAIFMGSGRLVPSDGFTACLRDQSWIGWPEGSIVRVIVSAPQVPSRAESYLRDTVAQVDDATAGKVQATFELTNEVNPQPSNGEITVTVVEDARSEGCLVKHGCIHVPNNGAVITSGQAFHDDTVVSQGYAHELGHGILGMCHIDGRQIGGPEESLMSGGPGVFNGDIAPRFSTRDVQASQAVYSSGLSLGATRSGPRKLDSGLSEISIVFQAAVPRPVAPKYTTSGVRRPSELCRRRPL